MLVVAARLARAIGADRTSPTSLGFIGRSVAKAASPFIDSVQIFLTIPASGTYPVRIRLRDFIGEFGGACEKLFEELGFTGKSFTLPCSICSCNAWRGAADVQRWTILHESVLVSVYKI